MESYIAGGCLPTRLPARRSGSTGGESCRRTSAISRPTSPRPDPRIFPVIRWRRVRPGRYGKRSSVPRKGSSGGRFVGGGRETRSRTAASATRSKRFPQSLLSHHNLNRTKRWRRCTTPASWTKTAVGEENVHVGLKQEDGTG